MSLDAVVIGLGAIGSGYDDERAAGAPPQSHAGAYAAHPRTRLAGGVDVDAAARARFTERWGVPAHPTVAEALEAHRPALVSVCTPPAGREQLVGALLEAGVRAVWAEKPLAAGSAEAAALAEACERAGVGLAVNFLRRLDPLHRRVAGELAARGGARHVDVRYSGTLAAYATHGVDLVRWWAGPVSAVTATPVSGREPVVALETASGASALLAQVLLGPVELFEVDAFADGARFALSGLGERLSVGEGAPSAQFAGVRTLPLGAPAGESGLAHAMMEGVTALAEHVLTGAPLPTPAADAVAALRVQEAVEASLAAGGRRIELEVHA